MPVVTIDCLVEYLHTTGLKPVILPKLAEMPRNAAANDDHGLVSPRSDWRTDIKMQERRIVLANVIVLLIY